MRGYPQLNFSLLFFYWFVHLFLIEFISWLLKPDGGFHWQAVFNAAAFWLLIPAFLIGSMAALLNVRRTPAGCAVLILLAALMSVFPLGIALGTFSGTVGVLIAAATGAAAVVPFALLHLPEKEIQLPENRLPRFQVARCGILHGLSRQTEYLFPPRAVRNPPAQIFV